MSQTLRERLEAAGAVLHTRAYGRRPRIAVVLGSGLGPLADGLADPVVVPYGEVPGFAVSTVAGHDGAVVLGRPPGCAAEVIAFKGRAHYYEGNDLADCVFPLRVAIALGARVVVQTNAAGGLHPAMRPGDQVLVSDHLNLLGGNPLRGRNDDGLGPRFPDLTDAYDPGLRAIAQAAAGALGRAPLREGVYACLSGPSYETPAEIRMLRALGADLVGMSTAPETIAARHMGARVLAISCVTNLAAGISAEKLSHHEVTETALRVRGEFRALVEEILRRVAATELS